MSFIRCKVSRYRSKCPLSGTWSCKVSVSGSSSLFREQKILTIQTKDLINNPAENGENGHKYGHTFGQNYWKNSFSNNWITNS